MAEYDVLLMMSDSIYQFANIYHYGQILKGATVVQTDKDWLTWVRGYKTFFLTQLSWAWNRKCS